MSLYLALAIGGVLGVYARYGMTQLIHQIYGHEFPLGTLVVNILGVFVLAFLFVETLERVSIPAVVRTGILTGGLGAFTTFSTFIVESMQLIENGETGKALLYLMLSITLGMTAAFGAVYMARNL